MLDFPAFGQSLWALYASTGIRPEYILPVFWLESNFNPGIVNGIGCTGIFQLCPLPGRPVPPGFSSLSASQQLNGYGISMYRNTVLTYGTIGSATRAYQANILPSTLATARTLDSVLAHRGSSVRIPQSTLTEAAVYNANAGLDADHNGAITVRDLSVKMRQYLAYPQVKAAIAQAYAVQPSQSPVADPAFGTDFAEPPPGSGWPVKDIALVIAAAAAVGVAVLAGTGHLNRPIGAIRRALA